MFLFALYQINLSTVWIKKDPVRLGNITICTRKTKQITSFKDIVGVFMYLWCVVVSVITDHQSFLYMRTLH